MIDKGNKKEKSEVNYLEILNKMELFLLHLHTNHMMLFFENDWAPQQRRRWNWRESKDPKFRFVSECLHLSTTDYKSQSLLKENWN